MPEEPQSTVRTSTPPNSKSFNTKKVAITVIIIAAVLATLGLGGWYVLSQQTNNGQGTTITKTSTPAATTQTSKDETANWKAYQNGNTNFTFKCPPTWVNNQVAPSDGLDTNGGSYVSYYCQDSTKGSLQTYLYVNYYSLPANASESLSSYSKLSSIEVGGSKTFTVDQIQTTYNRKPDIIVEGQTALRYSMVLKNYNYNNSNTLATFDYEGAILKKTYPSKKVFYDINVLSGSSITNRNTLIDQLISTFKFL